jgi:TonB family protein
LTAHSQLKSDLARWSLRSTRGQAGRRLSWINSICALFLFVGVVGARTHPPPPPVPPPLEQAAPVLIEPAPPPPPTAEKAPPPEENRAEQAPSAPVVVVPDSPAVNFSVPTIGMLIAPAALASAPPAEPMLPRQEPPSLRSTFLSNTGGSGDRPNPGEEDYPETAKKFRQQGTVVVQMTGDADGRIASLEIKHSSGSSILDRFTRSWVTARWKLPKGEPGHLYEAQFDYILMR